MTSFQWICVGMLALLELSILAMRGSNDEVDDSPSGLAKKDEQEKPPMEVTKTPVSVSTIKQPSDEKEITKPNVALPASTTVAGGLRRQKKTA